MSRNLITVENASVTLHSDGLHNKILKSIDFCLKQGEHIAILGPNGAGKSTFLRMLAGEIWIDQDHGKIEWNYEGKAENSPIMARYMTALVSPAQQEQYTRHAWQLQGKDILFTAFSLQNIAEAAQEQLIQNISTQLNCTNLLNISISALSQGQLRLLLLAKALLQKPKVLLLDEYLDGLDADTCSNIIAILEQISKETSLILSTHRKQGLVHWINKILYLHEGKLGPNKPQQSIAQNHTPSPVQASPVINHACPIIAVSKATVFVQRVPVLHNINWELHHGEHWSIHGKNGAGKSTFLRLLAGYEYPAIGGSIKRHFAMYPHEQNTTNIEHIRRAISLVSDFEQATYSYDLNGLEFILSGIDNVIGTYRRFSSQEITQAQDFLQELGLKSLQDRRIRTLSTGQLRFLCMARALIFKPQVLLLDEPFSGLDMHSRHKCIDIFESLSNDVQIILVSHQHDDILPMINREALLENGCLKYS